MWRVGESSRFQPSYAGASGWTVLGKQVEVVAREDGASSYTRTSPFQPEQA